MKRLASLSPLLLVLTLGCQPEPAAPSRDAGGPAPDAMPTDAGPLEPQGRDGGPSDAGSDAGPDGGSDAGWPDAGPLACPADYTECDSPSGCCADARDETLGEGELPRLQLDSRGVAELAFVDWERVMFASRRGGEWRTEEAADYGGGNYDASPHGSIGVTRGGDDHATIVHATWTGGPHTYTSHLRVSRAGAEGWDEEALLDTSAAEYVEVSADTDRYGRTHFCYSRSQGSSRLETLYGREIGGEWIVTPLESFRRCQLVAQPTGGALIALAGVGEISVLRIADDGAPSEPEVVASDYRYGGFAIAEGANGEVYVAYARGNELVLASSSVGGSERRVVGSRGGSFDLAVDAEGRPHVAYVESEDRWLWVATLRADGEWDARQLTEERTISPQIAIDPFGVAHVVAVTEDRRGYSHGSIRYFRYPLAI